MRAASWERIGIRAADQSAFHTVRLCSVQQPILLGTDKARNLFRTAAFLFMANDLRSGEFRHFARRIPPALRIRLLKIDGFNARQTDTADSLADTCVVYDRWACLRNMQIQLAVETRKRDRSVIEQDAGPVRGVLSPCEGFAELDLLR